MSIDVEELLRETSAPPMSLSPATVLGAAKQDVVRRRRRFAGLATAGVAAAAAVAITVGVVGGEQSAPRPMPAQTNTLDLNDPQKADFFGPSAGLPLGQIASSAIPIASDPSGAARTPMTKYVVTRQDGVLRLSRLDGSRQTLLPLAEKLSDGGSVTTDRKQTLMVHPLPADVRSAAQVISAQAMVEGGGTTLSDGSTVGVFWTSDPVNVSNVGLAWWRTTSGSLGSSTAETAKTVTLTAGGKKATYWEFTKSSFCGFDDETGAFATPMTNEQCPTDLSGSEDHVGWMQTVYGPISNLHSVTAPGVTDQAIVSASIPGTSRVVLWGSGTLAAGSGAGSDAPFSKVTWTGPDGKTHSWDAPTP
ncbi:hypothetical protein ATK17_2645 [Branchiibius hedensis]|uniref:Uncharacterized protein n=1 Tax=Branchiibius hedensis TaxID=672460 RepID=A0A2Y8ZTH9_9MICO|nr:hypothetical protein [Branchiibius hedensis]PWJ26482.1 hypothetical protein ATK17_2645 [Branchiibius hedensis]SSA35294.1 hypothetical protein SAMN04489750_2645 [Branchiibius hedensis]